MTTRSFVEDSEWACTFCSSFACLPLLLLSSLCCYWIRQGKGGTEAFGFPEPLLGNPSAVGRKAEALCLLLIFASAD